MGDMNLDLSLSCKNQCSFTRTFCDSMKNHKFSQLIVDKTRITERSETLIDHCYTNRPEIITRSGVISSGLSDHRSIFMIRRGSRPPTVHRTIRARSMKNFDNDSFINGMSAAPWNIIEMFDDVNDAWDSFKHIFISISDEHAPFKTVTMRGKSSPWVTRGHRSENLMTSTRGGWV